VNLFQWLTVPPLAALALFDLSRAVARRPRFRIDLLIRAVVWAAGAVAIYDPLLTVRIANVIGIETGTNLVVYLFALAFLGTSFFFYSRLIRMQRQITELIRHIAIREAEQRPPETGAT
jgi:small membrane protein